MQTARLVFETDAATVSTSSGRSERRSTTSALTPCVALEPLGDVQRAHGREGVGDERHVGALARARAASPIGVTNSGSSGTSPRSL